MKGEVRYFLSVPKVRYVDWVLQVQKFERVRSKCKRTVCKKSDKKSRKEFIFIFLEIPV